MSITEIENEDEFNQKVLQTIKPTFAYFYTDWNPPCRKLSDLFC